MIEGTRNVSILHVGVYSGQFLGVTYPKQFAHVI